MIDTDENTASNAPDLFRSPKLSGTGSERNRSPPGGAPWISNQSPSPFGQTVRKSGLAGQRHREAKGCSLIAAAGRLDRLVQTGTRVCCSKRAAAPARNFVDEPRGAWPGSDVLGRRSPKPTRGARSWTVAAPLAFLSATTAPSRLCAPRSARLAAGSPGADGGGEAGRWRLFVETALLGSLGFGLFLALCGRLLVGSCRLF